MKVIARKTNQLSPFVFDLIIGIVMTTAVIVVMLVSIILFDITLFANMQFTLIILGIMVIFGLVGYFGFIKPYLRYRKMPEIQAETDGEYLYLHGDKEAKIPLADMEDTYVEPDIPYMVTNEFFIHLLSERYGNVSIEVPKYGTYKLYYVAHAEDVANIIVDTILEKIN